MKLIKIHTITATLECQSGLRIASGDVEMHIGGIDNPIIRDPLTQHPYIPGSSLKGKIRSLMEWRSGCIGDGNPFTLDDYDDNGKCEEVLNILRMFGVGANQKIEQDDAELLGPGRLCFWDCKLKGSWVDQCIEQNIPLTEVKSENQIDRIKGTATPRVMERVISGSKFDFRLTVKEIDGDENKYLRLALIGMKLLAQDSLGGSGSRGSGKIGFTDIVVDGRKEDSSWQLFYDEKDPFSYKDSEA